MFRKLLEVVGGYFIVKTIFKAGEVVGAAKVAIVQIHNEAQELRNELKNRD